MKSLISVSMFLLCLLPSRSPCAIPIEGHPGWFFEPDSTAITMGNVQRLVSYGDDLLIWNLQSRRGTRQARVPGRWDGRELHRVQNLPSMDSRFKATVWRGDLIFAGRYLEPMGPDGSPRPYTSGDRILLYDGQSYAELQPGFSGQVRDLVAHRDTLLAAGRFVLKEGVPPVSLVFWDGSRWQPYVAQPRGGGEARIECLASRGDTLLVGGVFERMGPSEAWNIAMHDGQSWKPLGTGANGVVKQLALARGEIYAQGYFSCIGGREARNLARWDGTGWHAMPWPGGPVPAEAPLATATILGTPRGLFVLSAQHSMDPTANLGIFRWVDGSWDENMPSPHGTRWDFPRKKESRPRKAVSWKEGDPKPLSTPHSTPPPCPYEVISVPDIHKIEAMVWHQGRLLIVVSKTQDTDHFAKDPRMLALADDAWQEVVPPAPHSRSFIAPYRQGFLLQEGNDFLDRKLFATYPGGEDCLASWPRDGDHPQAFAVVGDTILVAGKFGFLDTGYYQHCALYDGGRWQAMGDGIPFDFIRSPRWHRTRHGIFLSGVVGNRECTPLTCLMKWDGREWGIVSSEPLDFQDRTRFVSNGEDLFRTTTRQRPFDVLRGPDHEENRFPAVLRPTIQRWTGDSWETAWTGVTGTISGFTTHGREIWGILDYCSESNFVHWDGRRWELCPAPTLAPLKRKPSPVFFNGRLCFPWIENREGMKSRTRLAFFEDGIWQAMGPAITQIFNAPLPADSPRLRVTMAVGQEGPPVSGWLEWDGTLGPLSPLPTLDLTALNAWRDTCANSDQRDRHDLDLPWPRGLPHSDPEEAPYPTPSAEDREGWFLSDWPGDTPLEEIFEMRDGTLVLHANASVVPQLNFHLEAESCGELEFEFRLVEPERWFDEERNPPRNYEEEMLAPSLILLNSGDFDQQILWARDELWHEIKRPFRVKKTHDPGSPCLIFSAGENPEAAGRLEIRNLRFHMKKKYEGRSQAKDLARRLKRYPWSSEARPRIKAVLKNFRGRRVRFPWDSLDYMNFASSALVNQGWLGKELLLPEEKPTWNPDRSRQIREVVSNYGGGSGLASGWLPGGGRYFQTESRVAPIVEFLQAAEADFSEKGLIQGVVLDFRGQDHPSWFLKPEFRQEFLRSWSYFVDHEFVWMEIQPHHEEPRKETISALARPEGRLPWPVVAIMDHTTDGLLGLLLNETPGITTIGTPSAPVNAPCAPQRLLDGWIASLPAGLILDPRGRNISFTRIAPDIQVPLNAEYSAPIREAMNVLGLKPDPDASFCPVDRE